MTTYRWIPALALGVLFLFAPAPDADAGPLDRIRGTKCDATGCQGASMKQEQRARVTKKKTANEARLKQLYSGAPAPPPAPQRAPVIRFDTTDPLYQLLMKTLITESEARTRALQGDKKP